MWFIGVEVEQETNAHPPKKKSWIRPWKCPEGGTIKEYPSQKRERKFRPCVFRMLLE